MCCYYCFRNTYAVRRFYGIDQRFYGPDIILAEHYVTLEGPVKYQETASLIIEAFEECPVLEFFCTDELIRPLATLFVLPPSKDLIHGCHDNWPTNVIYPYKVFNLSVMPTDSSTSKMYFWPLISHLLLTR